jgi:hypothetical protein
MRKYLFSTALLFIPVLILGLGATAQTGYGNKAERQKLVMQLKAAIENISVNLSALKGERTTKVPDDFDTTGLNIYKTKKTFALATFSAVTNIKGEKNNELYVEFNGFASDEEATTFGESLNDALRALTYSFGKLISEASGSESVLELDVNKGKNVPKAVQGLKVFVNIPGDVDNIWHNKVTVRVFRADW